MDEQLTVRPVFMLVVIDLWTVRYWATLKTEKAKTKYHKHRCY